MREFADGRCDDDSGGDGGGGDSGSSDVTVRWQSGWVMRMVVLMRMVW